MALNVENEQPQQQQQQGRSAPQGQAFEQPRAQSAARNAFSFIDTGALAPAPMGRNPGSEILIRLTKELQASFETAKDAVVTALPIDRSNEVNLAFSLIIVALHPIGNKEQVSFHTLILESSNTNILPRYENINGTNVEVLRVASDAYDSVLIDVVRTNLERAFPGSAFINAGNCVVPNSFKFDENSKELVYRLAANSVLACYTEMVTRQQSFVDLNLANARKDATLQTRTSFGRGEVVDAVGLPVRADVTIELLASQQSNRNDQSLNNGADNANLVTSVTGFIDLVWNWKPNQAFAYGQNQQAMFQKYAPRLIITGLNPARLLTLPAQLLALVTAVSLREDNAWIGAFRNKSTTGGKIEMHDIGGVGVEANLENDPSGFGARVNTKADSFRPEHLHKLIAATIQPQFFISMDIPEGGASSWYNEAFRFAAKGSANANQAIYNAAQQLTNGLFGKYFNREQRIVLDDGNRVHLGYYTDSNGIRRDIRDVDYLAVANYVGEKDPATLRAWSDSFLRTEYPLIQRLQERKQTIVSLLPDATITGMATRVTFDLPFIEALVRACKELGLSFRNISNYSDTGTFERATGSMFSSAMMGSLSSGLFNRDTGSTGTTYGGGYNRFG